ncbi:MAG: DUF2069 domain-containing protein [Rudaea sp.]|nr:DUF2069 domain-containing protein [Rudaea sp.]
MNPARFDALHAGAAALFLLALLQILWHAWLAPPPGAQLWPTLFVAVGPLVPGLWVCRHNLRRGVLIGGIVCLFYFCHGIASAWADISVRQPALAEVALSLVVIGVLGWDARHYRRPQNKEN